MIVVYSVLAGLVWGAIFGLIGALLTKKTVSADDRKIASLSMTRTLIDLAALAVVYFTRNLLPLRFEITIISAAITLSFVAIFTSFRIAASMKK